MAIRIVARAGGVAQWFGRLSSASGLSLPCAQSAVDRRPHFTGKLSVTGQPTSTTQPSISLGSVNEQ